MFVTPFTRTASALVRSMSSSTAGVGRLSGKVAVVTASTDGIGYAIAKKLGEEGAHVVVSSRKMDNVERAVSDLKAANLQVTGMACHVGKAEDRKALFDLVKEQFGGLDILVSNAAVNPYFGSALATPEAAYDKIFDVNVKATFQLIQEAVPLMKGRDNSSITIVSSIGGYTPFELLGIYSVSKTALIGLTKALTPELADHKIRVNCLCPGVIRTKFSGALWKDQAAEEECLKMIPMNRLGEPEDCGGVVSFLSSDDARFVTGESIVVAGGSQSRL